MRFGARWIYVIFECKFLSSWPQTWQFYGPVFSVAPCSSGCPYNSYNSAGVARAGWGPGTIFWGIREPLLQWQIKVQIFIPIPY